MKTLQEQLVNIMDNFDFERVEKVMRYLDWRWITADNGVPDIVEMRVLSRDLLKEVYKRAERSKDDVSIGTGAFKATACYFEDGEILLELQFVVANWDNFY